MFSDIHPPFSGLALGKAIIKPVSGYYRAIIQAFYTFQQHTDREERESHQQLHPLAA